MREPNRKEAEETFDIFDFGRHLLEWHREVVVTNIWRKRLQLGYIVSGGTGRAGTRLFAFNI